MKYNARENSKHKYKWGRAEALQKKLEGCRGSLCTSQQYNRPRNNQLDFKKNSLTLDQVSNNNEIETLDKRTSGEQTISTSGSF